MAFKLFFFSVDELWGEVRVCVYAYVTDKFFISSVSILPSFLPHRLLCLTGISGRMQQHQN